MPKQLFVEVSVNSRLRQHYQPRPDRVPRLLRRLWSWL
jgi:hypothetical protein